VDAVALTAFTAVGVLTHGSSFAAFLRDLVVFLGCWFAAAAAARLYTSGGWARLAATWLAGITAAVFVRAAIVGHIALDFYVVALAFTIVFVVAARLAAARL
jgi:hypothetical protein